MRQIPAVTGPEANQLVHGTAQEGSHLVPGKPLIAHLLSAIGCPMPGGAYDAALRALPLTR